MSGRPETVQMRGTPEKNGTRAAKWSFESYCARCCAVRSKPHTMSNFGNPCAEFFLLLSARSPGK